MSEEEAIEIAIDEALNDDVFLGVSLNLCLVSLGVSYNEIPCIKELLSKHLCELYNHKMTIKDNIYKFQRHVYSYLINNKISELLLEVKIKARQEKLSKLLEIME